MNAMGDLGTEAWIEAARCYDGLLKAHVAIPVVLLSGFSRLPLSALPLF